MKTIADADAWIKKQTDLGMKYTITKMWRAMGKMERPWTFAQISRACGVPEDYVRQYVECLVIFNKVTKCDPLMVLSPRKLFWVGFFGGLRKHENHYRMEVDKPILPGEDVTSLPVLGGCLGNQ